jgi:hypothetical protein
LITGQSLSDFLRWRGGLYQGFLAGWTKKNYH